MNIYDTKENIFSQIINCMINRTIITCTYLFLILISLTAILMVVSDDVADVTLQSFSVYRD